jgi:hypothetical protein
MTNDSSDQQSQEQKEFQNEGLGDRLQHYSDEFDTLQQLRHIDGAKEYGEITFLKAPLVRMAAEELADLCNYARYMYIKLRVMEEALNASGIDLSASPVEEVWGDNEVSFGAASFIPAEEIQGFLSQEKPSG